MKFPCCSKVLVYKDTALNHPIFLFPAREDVCDNKNLTTGTGIISSTGFPLKYTKNLDCTSTITVGAGKKILLNFTMFDIESASECEFDYLHIIDGSISSKFCGNRTGNLTLYRSETSKLTLKFKTDYAKNLGGYYATYTSIDGKPIKHDLIL